MNIQLPSTNDIIEAYRQGEDAVVRLVKGVNQNVLDLLEQNQKLRDQLAKNSSNSSLPPSGDGPKDKRKRTTSLRKPGEKPNGGQPGHEGNRLEPVEEPDSIVVHAVDECERCHSSLHNVPASHSKRQVFDIPAIRLEVTEHQGEIKVCPGCGHDNKANFPDGVTQETQYGQNVKAHAVYFNTQHHVPLERTADIFEDVFGHRISEGMILQSAKECDESVRPVNEIIKSALICSDVAGFDESGLKVNVENHWLHICSTDELTYYEVHQKRGKEAMDDIGILPLFRGVATHDHWKSYLKFNSVDHALCNAHHLRELTFIVNQYDQEWATDMIELLVEINNAVKQAPAGATSLDPDALSIFESRYDSILDKGFEINPPPEKEKGKRGRPKQSPPKNILDRLRDFKPEVLRFMHDFRVPFDNNQAERDIRMIKVKQKVSGTFRTFEGAQRFCAIRGYISTARKNAVNIIEAIKGAFGGSPFIPSLP